MFLDYYAILHIDSGASPEEIRAAYIELVKIWHPDRNPFPDAHKMMQQLNEAYMILKNPECREKYDKEYRQFKEAQEEYKEAEQHFSEEDYSNTQNIYEEYEVRDEKLREWINRARAKAHELNDVTLEDIGGMTVAAASSFCSTVKSGCLPLIICNIIAFLIFICLS